MILFKPEHVVPILTGRKRQTRRRWPRGPRVRVGSLHQCRTRMLVKNTTFARIAVDELRREELRAISDDDARLEGYEDRAAYFGVWGRIHADVQQQERELVYVITFHLAEVPCYGCRGAGVRQNGETCDECEGSGFVPVRGPLRPEQARTLYSLTTGVCR